MIIINRFDFMKFPFAQNKTEKFMFAKPGVLVRFLEFSNIIKYALTINLSNTKVN